MDVRMAKSRCIQWVLILVALLLDSGSTFAASTPPEWTGRGELSTDTDGVGRSLQSGAVVELGSQTIVQRTGTMRVELAGVGTGKALADSLKLREGQVDLSFPGVASGSRGAVVIQAPHKVTVIAHSGRVRVTVRNDVVAVASYDSTIMAAVGTKWKPLAAGQRRVVGGEFPQGETLPLAAAPLVQLSAPVQLTLPERASNTTVRMESNEPQSRFVIRVRRTGDVGEPVDTLLSASPTVELAAYPPAVYEVSGTTLDRFGLEGETSTPVTLRVVGVEIPVGASIVGRSVSLRPRQRVRLVQAQGLELTYDGGSYFVPVPSNIGLNRGRSVLVRVRQPGDPREATLKLEVRALHADVEFSPATARWPRDEVTVRVRFAHGESHASAVGTTQVAVTVNGKPQVLTWKGHGAERRALVPAPASPGPWVVRAVVRDAQGNVLRRDFLEVARSSSN